MLQYSIVQYGIVQYSMVQYSMVQHTIVHLVSFAIVCYSTSKLDSCNALLQSIFCLNQFCTASHIFSEQFDGHKSFSTVAAQQRKAVFVFSPVFAYKYQPFYSVTVPRFLVMKQNNIHNDTIFLTSMFTYLLFQQRSSFHINLCFRQYDIK